MPACPANKPCVTTATRIFAYEQTIGKPLARIPMAVRLNLDLCQTKISLGAWSTLALEQKQHLARLTCELPAEAALFLGILQSGLAPEDIINTDHDHTPAVTPDWLVFLRTHLPPAVNAHCAHCALAPISGHAWRALNDLQRYALIKLSRAGHDNTHFVAAVAEFGVFTP